MIKDTIVALAGGVNQAIAIIRLSGDEALKIASSVMKSSMLKQKSHTIIHNYIIDLGEVVDEVMVSYFAAPKSYTTEDMVEINIHGSSYIANRVVSLLIEKGARMANRGEFTQRAYLNKRIDLTQAEAIKDLIESNTFYSGKMAISGVMGSTFTLVEDLRGSLLETIGNIEVNIDYPEYDDVEQLTNDIIKPRIISWLDRISKIIKKTETNLLIKDGVITAIVGKPNVGKSTLLNALLEENKALVSEVEGTTRDIVEGEVIIDDLKLKLLDTAGLRSTEDLVEKLGIEKTKEAIEKANLVILVLDNKDRDNKEWLKLIKNKLHIVVYNKSDINNNIEGIKISALKNDLKELKDEIKRLIVDEELKPNEMLQSARQLGLMKQAKESISSALETINNGKELELVSIDLNQAYQQLSDIVGQYHRSDLLDSMFSNFCLGK